MDPSRIAVVGSGYVGTIVAGCLAHVGHQVRAVEINPEKLEQLRQGRAPFFERGADTLVSEALAQGRLAFTDDIGEAVAVSDLIFLCVETPSAADGHTDVRALAAAIHSIGAVLDSRKTIVSKSTAPIGSGRWVEAMIEDAIPAHARCASLSVVSNPEFLRQGSAIEDFLHPDRVVIGSNDPRALEAVVNVYRPILEQSFEAGDRHHLPGLVRTTLATAETVKYASNAFLALKISFANEIANVCELVGADVTDVADALGYDSRIGRAFLDAGIGWGGSCFGKDLSELIATATEHGYDARLFRAAQEVNRFQRAVVVRKLRRLLRGLRGRRIGILGLAFKPGTDDLRDAPAIDIAAALLQGGASVVAHDPVVRSVAGLGTIRLVGEPYEVAERADAVVLVTDWPEYRNIEFSVLESRMRGNLLVDGRNFFDRTKVQAAGLVYEGVGRRAEAT